MSFEVVTVHEIRIAKFPLKWSFAGVNSSVHFDIATCFECFTANIARIGSVVAVARHMSSESVAVSKSFFANFAFVWLLAGVCPNM